MVWLSGLVPFTQVEQILPEVGGIDISQSSVCWKELKIGCVFDIASRRQFDPHTQEEIELGSAIHNSYVAHLGGPAVFGRQLWAEARQRFRMHAEDSLTLGDGATWIWNLVDKHFYASHQLVDWYHATEHLANTAKSLYGEGTPAAQRWYRRWETRLYQDHVDQLVQALKQQAGQQPHKAEALHKEMGYFHNNRKRMNYLNLRSEGYPISSGMMESAAKQHKTRFCGPGMHWSRKGAERLLPVRAAILSSRLDKMW